MFLHFVSQDWGFQTLVIIVVVKQMSSTHPPSFSWIFCTPSVSQPPLELWFLSCSSLTCVVSGRMFHFDKSSGGLHSFFPLVNYVCYGSVCISIKMNRHFGDDQGFEANCFSVSNWLVYAFIVTRWELNGSFFKTPLLIFEVRRRVLAV